MHFYVYRFQKHKKDIDNLTAFLHHVKAVGKMMVKSTPGVNSSTFTGAFCTDILAAKKIKPKTALQFMALKFCTKNVCVKR